ncbi:MAG: 30S ribosomal protein S6 [Planctomycetota bacterium]|nr:30S ribosomal protein S6 [Planctomycetota bacterium]
MAKNTYETLLILDSNHYARDPSGISKRLEEIVTEAGGTVMVNRLWMEQKLAYPIDKHQKGTYWLIYHEIDGINIPKMDRGFQLYEPVVRHLTIKLEARLVEPILANARGESVKVSTPTDSSGTEERDGGSEDALEADASTETAST